MTRFVLWLKANASTIFLSIHVKNVMLGQLVCMLYWEWLDISFLSQIVRTCVLHNIRRRNKNRHFTIAACFFGDDKYLVSGMGCS